MKTYKYTQEQVDKIYGYLMSRPMAEAEALVAILRTPQNLDEITGTVAKEETSEQESKKDGSKGKKG